MKQNHFKSYFPFSSHQRPLAMQQFARRAIITAHLGVGCFLLLLLPFTALATMERQSLPAIKAAVTQYLEKNIAAEVDAEININIGRIDPRLQLRHCNKPLEPFNKSDHRLSGNTTIGVRCHSPKSWTVYIPVEINIYEDVIASAHPLTRGQRIGAQDIKTIKLRTSHKNIAYYKTPDYIIGMVVTQNLRAGKVISPKLLRAPKLVKRGESVTLLAKTSQLSVRMRGKAMEDGAKGDVIKVRNLSSNRIIEGTVAKTGVVEVPM